MSTKIELEEEFKSLLGQYLEDFLYPIYSERNAMFGIFIKKGKDVLFNNYESSYELINECYNNLYAHKKLIDSKDPKFFLDKNIKIFPKVPEEFTKSFRLMWRDGNDNELPDDEKDMSWKWFSQFLEIMEEWKIVGNKT